MILKASFGSVFSVPVHPQLFTDFTPAQKDAEKINQHHPENYCIAGDHVIHGIWKSLHQ